jgi:hypothetical protein
VAAGFAQGEIDPKIDAFRVKELNAHTWVEAYFPTYGWIEFEPTTVITPINRPATATAGQADSGLLPGERGPADIPTDAGLGRGQPKSAQGDGRDQGAFTLLGGLLISPLVGWLLALAVIAALFAAGVWFWLELNGLENLSEISRSYARMNIFASLAGLPLDESATPLERGQQIAAAVPEGRDFVQRITSLYMRERYAPPVAKPRPDDRRGEVARSDWQSLRPIMAKAALKTQFSRFRRSRKRV